MSKKLSPRELLLPLLLVFLGIANEPIGVTWERIVEYANEIIPVIRRHDANAVILVGTRGMVFTEGIGGQQTAKSFTIT